VIYSETAMPKEPTKQVLFSAALCFGSFDDVVKAGEYIGGCLFFSTS
jgi:hypothetical protein